MLLGGFVRAEARGCRAIGVLRKLDTTMWECRGQLQQLRGRVLVGEG
jgi:hypothetical protein